MQNPTRDQGFKKKMCLASSSFDQHKKLMFSMNVRVSPLFSISYFYSMSIYP